MKIDFQDKIQNLISHYARHVLVIFVVVLFVHDIFGNHGFLVMRRKQQEIQKVKLELDRLNKENSGYEQDVKDLKTDPQTIERIAREELNQSKPGEVIIRLPAPVTQATLVAKP